MTEFLAKFARDESGAVTVDWVVLTAALVGLGVGVVLVIREGAVSTSNSLGNALTSMEIQEY